jgi:hypothetical protein
MLRELVHPVNHQNILGHRLENWDFEHSFGLEESTSDPKAR